VHVYRAIGVRTAYVKDVELLQLGQLQEFDAVGREELACETRGLAACMRLKLVRLARVVQGTRPVLERYNFQGSDRITDAEHRRPHAAREWRRAAKHYPSRLVARCGFAGCLLPGRLRHRFDSRHGKQCRAKLHKSFHADLSSCSHRGACLHRPHHRSPHRRTGLVQLLLLSRWLEPASSSTPGAPPVAATVTVRALTRSLPLRAMKPSTLISVPIFRVSRRQPRRCSRCGGPSSAPQLVTLPLPSS